MRRGAEVMRTDKAVSAGPGMTWEAQFSFRGKGRRVAIRLDALVPPSRLVLSGNSTPVSATVQIGLVDLSTLRTRIDVRLEVLPRTFAARIYLQSLRLARARVERSFAQRVAQLSLEIEDRFRRNRPA